MSKNPITNMDIRMLNKAYRKPRRNKYNNKRCQLNGIHFDSLKERDYYIALKEREKHGEIANLDIHPRWPILINGIKVCDVFLDFAFDDHIAKTRRFVDVKGFYPPFSQLKHKLLTASHGITVELA